MPLELSFLKIFYNLFLQQFFKQQIIINIINNALRYTADEGKLKIKSRLDKNQVFACISDTGIDMNDKQIQKNFKPILSKFSQ
ncbi:ATP-binding protein [Dehalococcoides sp.]|uniref:ATP-binding protein n=1 Tax=Dehalococcoides sp. TaxID=1966486 RepID=UPI0009BD02E4